MPNQIESDPFERWLQHLKLAETLPSGRVPLWMDSLVIVRDTMTFARAACLSHFGDNKFSNDDVLRVLDLMLRTHLAALDRQSRAPFAAEGVEDE